MADRYPITTLIPKYDEARKLLQFLEGERFSLWRSMIDEIYDKWKSPEMKGKWSDPEVYIPLVTSGEVKDFAFRIWDETKYNPRTTGNSVNLAEHHCLADWSNDIISLTETGKQFLDNDENTVAKIDRFEGILVILEVAAAKGPSKEDDYVPAFQEFFREYTTFSQKNSGVFALRYRLHNLNQRGLLEKTGNQYTISSEGHIYLRQNNPILPQPNTPPVAVPPPTPPNPIEELASEKSNAARRQLAHQLQSMDPFHFEHLIKKLLENMGYDNVKVTAASNDKGVDVVADIELGISRVREVIQVKRQQSNIGRPVLDRLRGSLWQFNAVRGSIITTGGFTHSARETAFVPNVAPITLIDGEHLLHLLIEHKIGVLRKEISYLEFDPSSLARFELEDGEIAP